MALSDACLTVCVARSRHCPPSSVQIHPDLANHRGHSHHVRPGRQGLQLHHFPSQAGQSRPLGSLFSYAHSSFAGHRPVCFCFSRRCSMPFHFSGRSSSTPSSSSRTNNSMTRSCSAFSRAAATYSSRGPSASSFSPAPSVWSPSCTRSTCRCPRAFASAFSFL